MQLVGAGPLFSQSDFVHRGGEALVYTQAVVEGVGSSICCLAASASAYRPLCREAHSRPEEAL